MANEPILVTGGAGFIGGTFVRSWLAEADGPVVNLDALTYAADRESLVEADADGEHLFVEGDVADSRLVAELLAEHRPRAVVHLAAESHVDRSIDAPAPFVRTNVVGTWTLLDESLRYWRTLTPARRERFRFVHVSTDEVYGSASPDESFAEQDAYDPSSPYAASKAASDHFARAYHRTYGLPAIVTRSSNNYGPFQFPEKLIPLMILNAIEGKPLPIYGDGLQVRDWLFVEDHCRALRAVVERGAAGASYNIAGGEARTNLEVVQLLCRLVDRMSPGLPHAPCERLLKHVADRPGHDRRYALDATKITRELDWRPRWTLETGLEATVRWYLEHPEWIDRVSRDGDARQRQGLDRKR
jgi:dTDP-glucose 4,6-dehydratase